MIADGVQIGFQGPGTLGGRFGSGELMKVMGGVREIGTDGDGRLTVAKAPIGSDDCRKGCDRRESVVLRVFLAAEAENGRGHAQGVHGGRIHSRSFA